MSCQNEHRNSRSNEVYTQEIVQKIHKMVLDDRRLKLHERADILDIPKRAVYYILTKNKNMRKLCARWVPQSLTTKQKQRRDDVSIEFLAMFHSDKAEFLRRSITIDETWVHNFTTETMAQSKQWIKREESAPNKGKTVPSTSKVMASFFWVARGIIFIDCLQEGRLTTNIT